MIYWHSFAVLIFASIVEFKFPLCQVGLQRILYCNWMGSKTTEVLFVPRTNLLPEATVKRAFFSSFLQCRSSVFLTLAIKLMIHFLSPNYMECKFWAEPIRYTLIKVVKNPSYDFHSCSSLNIRTELVYLCFSVFVIISVRCLFHCCIHIYDSSFLVFIISSRQFSCKGILFISQLKEF